MSQRCLLFSSDEESSRRLIQALHELELEVVTCPEIFAAIETLTRQKVDVVVADLDAGLEATFLLKNVRDLRLNKDAATAAIVHESARRAAQDTGADVILTKPIDINQVKYGLLGSDRFLASMRRDQARLRPVITRETPPPPPGVTEPPRHLPPSLSIDSVLAATKVAPSPTPKRELLPSLRPARPPVPGGKLGAQRHGFPVTGPASPGGRAHYRTWVSGRRSKFLLGGTFGIVVLAVAYVLTPAANAAQALATMTDVGQWAWQKAGVGAAEARRSWAQKSAESRPAVRPVAQTAAFELPAAFDIASPKVRAVPSHRAMPVPAPPLPVTGSSPPITQAHPPGGTPAADIPDSIKRPQPGVDSVHVISSKLTVLGELEPVNLSEQASEELLLSKVQPSYPEQAVRSGLQGAVVLQAWIGQDGKVQDLKLVRGPLLLGQAAYHAVKQWRYKPYLRAGKAMEALTYVTVTFSLQQQSLVSPANH